MLDPLRPLLVVPEAGLAHHLLELCLRRSARRSGSKVITDPVELGPDLRELVGERGLGLGHRRADGTGPTRPAGEGLQSSHVSDLGADSAFARSDRCS